MGDVQLQLEKLRKACLKRGVHGIKTIGRTFRLYDDNRNHQLDMNEFMTGLQDYQTDFNSTEVQQLFKYFDKDDSGSINFDEFLMQLRPPMSRARKDIIDLAFNKMDNTGDGIVTIEDLAAKYDITHHPKYKSGEWTKKQVLQEYLDSFQIGPKDDKVTKEEFLNYYAGVSASIDKDVYFDYMMRQSWKL